MLFNDKNDSYVLFFNKSLFDDEQIAYPYQYVYDNTNSKKVSKEKFKDRVCELVNVKLSFKTSELGNRFWVFVPKDLNTKSKK